MHGERVVERGAGLVLIEPMFRAALAGALARVAALRPLLAVTGPLPDLSSIPAPALAILSSGGTFSDPAKSTQLLAPLPVCRIERIAAQHWIPTEQPLALRAAIETWCDTLEFQGAADR